MSFSPRALLDNKATRILGVSWQPGYLKKSFRNDLMAGLNVAVMGVPQAMAYAMLAGLPPALGLYTAIISGAIGAIFGSSSHLITGPTNASCMVILSVVAPYVDLDNGLEVVFLLSVICGLIKIVFGVLRMGGIVRYISNSVVLGFTSGVAVLIIGNQVKNVLGVRLSLEGSPLFYQTLFASFAKWQDANLYSVGVAVVTILLVTLLGRISKRIPAPFIGIAFGALLVGVLHLDSLGVRTVRDIAPISPSLNIFHVPDLLWPLNFELIGNLFWGAIAVALFGLIEASTSSRGLAALSGQRLDFSREFVGQGLANLGGAFFMNFPSSGSFVRSVLCYQSGGRTRMASIFTSMFIAAVILTLARFANYIPQASLAGMLFCVAYGMVAKQRARLVMAWKSGGPSKMVLFGTLVATLVLPLQFAIFVGVFLSIVFLLRITSKTDLTLLVPRAGGRFDEVPHGQSPADPIVIVNMEGDLYFAAVENLDYQLRRALTPETRVLILRMKRLRAVGSSAMAILEHFHEMLHEMGVSLVVSGIEKSLAGVMDRSGLRAKIGEQNIFYADNTLFQSTELALARARGIVQMERRRAREKSTDEKPPEAPAPETPALPASDFMSRQCIRFGNGHSVREAVWLLSEMNRRMNLTGAEPLFLQDEHGVLSGELTPWRLMETLMQGVSPAELENMSDEEVGQCFARAFPRPVGPLSNKDLPPLTPTTGVARLIVESVHRDMAVLPIRDAEGRVIGRVNQAALLAALGRALNMAQPEPDASGDAPPS